MVDSVPVRLGGLAANMARIASFTSRGASLEAILSLFQESKYFIEWTAPEVDPEFGSELADMQVALAIWQRIWPEARSNASLRALLSIQARSWSNSVLQQSGLLTGS